jgi:Leucine-rich repeat (LRR) protein
VGSAFVFRYLGNNSLSTSEEFKPHEAPLRSAEGDTVVRTYSRPASMGDVQSARSSDEMRCFEPNVDVATIVLSHVDGVETRVALACVSRTWRNAARLPESRPARYDGMLLRVLRESIPGLEDLWPESQAPEAWIGVDMEDDRVVRLNFSAELTYPTPRPLLAVPAVIGQFASLTVLNLSSTQLTSVPAEIWQLTSLQWLYLSRNQLTSLPAEIGQLTSLQWLYLIDNRLTSLPAEIGQLTSLRELRLIGNSLTGLPAEIGQLTSLEGLYLSCNLLTSLPAEIGQLTSLTLLDLFNNNLTSLPAEIGQLASLKSFYVGNLLMSVPASIINELRARGCNVET